MLPKLVMPELVLWVSLMLLIAFALKASSLGDWVTALYVIDGK